ncbi:MAG: hypothetical protein PF961_14770, partial [Planctomycetota bacterium]|nr:hypothetical protein [Planctomycetota bacterium]
MRLALLGVLVLFVMLPAASLSAADYYFSTAGNDGSGDGTISKPWASLSKLNGLNLGPGDRVYLRGGDSFSGSVVIAAADAGTAANPVRFASYGTGRAVISPGADQNGFDIYNAAGVEIRQLEVDGGDLSTHNKNGIGLYNDLAGNTRLEHVVISDCVVRNCHAGITVGAWASDNSYSGFADVTIERTLVRDCEDNGIVSWGMSSSSATSQSHRNITVRDCEVTGVTGDPDKTDGHSGSGIIMAGTIGGLVEGCYAHHNGGGGGRPTGGGPVGIWAWGAADVTIRRSLVHDQKTINGAVDGGGFDLDGGAVN